MSWCGTLWEATCSGQSSGQTTPTQGLPALPLPSLLLLTWLIASPGATGTCALWTQRRPLPCEGSVGERPPPRRLGLGTWSPVVFGRCLQVRFPIFWAWGQICGARREGNGRRRGFSTTICLATSSGAFPQFLVWIREFLERSKCLPQVVPSGCPLRLSDCSGWLGNLARLRRGFLAFCFFQIYANKTQKPDTE